MYCYTVSYGKVRGKAKQYPYYQTAMYQQYVTKDCRCIWKYIRHCDRAYRSYNKAEKLTKILSLQDNIPYIQGIRNNTEVKK